MPGTIHDHPARPARDGFFMPGRKHSWLWNKYPIPLADLLLLNCQACCRSPAGQVVTVSGEENRNEYRNILCRRHLFPGKLRFACSCQEHRFNLIVCELIS